MKAIVCIDEKNGIGKNGELLISIPDDMKHFRETTRDSIVIMGRKTLFSFKNRSPLKGRINIVFTNDISLKEQYAEFDNIYFVKEKKEMFDIMSKYKEKEVFVIGGATIYKELIDDCNELIITKVYKTFDADTFFPNINDLGYEISKCSEDMFYDNIKYNFITYKKRK